MNKVVKIGAIIAGVILLLIIAVFVLAKVLITPERVRSTVLPIAEDALQREIDLSDIEVSIFSGIELKGLTVKEREGDENFVAADVVELRYKFWPLLFMQVVVDEVRLEGPKIRVIRKSDGSFNFSDLLAVDKEQTAADVKKIEEEEGAPINLLVSELVISEGELLFLDHAISEDGPYRYQLTELSVEASDLALDRAFPYALRARLKEAALQVEGKINPQEPSGTADLELSGFDATAFLPYFRDQFPGTLGSLKIDLDLQAEGGMDQVVSKGTVALREIDMVLDAMEDAPIRAARVTLDYDIAADLKASVLTLNKAAADLNGIAVEASGKISDYATQPSVDLAVKLPALELRKALAAVPESLVKDVAQMDPSGVITADLNLAGPVSEPMKLLQQGRIELDKVQASSAGMRPSLSGRIHLQGDALSSDALSLQMGGNQLDIDLKAGNLLGEPIALTSQITSERFDLAPLLEASAAPATAGEQKADGPKEETAGEIGPFDLPLKAVGSVQIATALYQGLEVNDFDLAYQLENNILTIEHMKGQIAGGSFNKTARVDLGQEGLAYQATVNVEGVKADPFVSAFVPKASNTIFGELFFDLAAKGQGTQFEAIQRTLSGNGDFRLMDGKITGAGLAEGLAQFLDLEQLRVLRFSELKGNYAIENGKVRINSDFSGSDVKMHPTGTIGLDGSLNLALDASLAPEHAGNIGGGELAQFLKDEQGWTQLPVKVAGSVTDPRFTLDTSAAQQRLKERAREEVEQKLQEKVFDKLAPKNGEGESQEPAKKMLDDTLRGIFGN